MLAQTDDINSPKTCIAHATGLVETTFEKTNFYVKISPFIDRYS